MNAMTEEPKWPNIAHKHHDNQLQDARESELVIFGLAF